MLTRWRFIKPLVVVLALAAPPTLTACAPHRVHDPYYNDYHRWDRAEEVRYEQWESQTNRRHEDFSRRSTDEQHAYFDWRHNQH